MTITLNDDEIRDLIAKHLQSKFQNIVATEVYLIVDEETGVFSNAEAAIEDSTISQ